MNDTTEAVSPIANTNATYNGNMLERGHRINVKVDQTESEVTVLNPEITKSGKILVCQKIGNSRTHLLIPVSAITNLFLFMDLDYVKNPGQSRHAHTGAG